MKYSLTAVGFLANILSLSVNNAVASTPYQETVLVTATRTPVPVMQSLASATVISRDKIELLQPSDLVNLLQRTPSLDVSRSGGPGSATNVYTRGTGGDHTLILVDGQRVNSATQGGVSFENLNPEQIERIEVVRGSRSSLYGSDAIGGVIQIFTRDGRTNPSTWISTGIGSHHLQEYAAGTSGRQDGFFYSGNLSYLETEGIDNLTVDTGFNKDDDAYRNQSANASLGYEFANGADLQLRLLDSNGYSEYDSASAPTTQPYSKAHLQNTNLQSSLPVTDKWKTQLSVGQAVTDSKNYNKISDKRTSNFRTERDQIFWQNDVTVAEGQVLTLAYDYYDDEVDSSSRYVNTSGVPVKTRDNHARLALYQGDFSGFDITGGVREDDNEEFGTHTTSNVGVGIELGSLYKVIASWAEGFKSPTFNDLYWPTTASAAGNPDLVPEQSENVELTLRAIYDSWHWDLTWFQNDVDNLINWAQGPDRIYRPYNVSTVEIEGGEFIAGTEWNGLLVDASYTYVEARDSETDKYLPTRARSNFVMSIDQPLGDWMLGVSLKAQDKRYINTANSGYVAGYATADLRAQYKVTPNLKLNFIYNNIFDKDYQLNNGYNQDDLNWKIKMTYTL